MSAGNRISFEIPIPNPEAQQEQFLTFDLGDDWTEYVVKPDGVLWRVYDDWNHEPAPFSFTGVVETESPFYYWLLFKEGQLLKLLAMPDEDFGRIVVDNLYLELEFTKPHVFDGSDLDHSFSMLHGIFVDFTQEQKAAIRALAAAGDVTGVRSALWDEIEREYEKPRPESMR